MSVDAQLERAILTVFDQFNTSGEARRQGNAYIQQVCAQPNAWQITAGLLKTSNHQQVKFWCLQYILSIVNSSWQRMQTQDRNVLKHVLLSYIRDVVCQRDQPLHIKNKLAVVVIAIMQREYPEQWPSFFGDIRGMMNTPLGIDMWFRLLNTFHQEVVELPENPSKERSALSMRLKDEMRAREVKNLVTLWAQVLDQTQHKANAIAKTCLACMHKYTMWIEVTLVANAGFLSMFFKFLEVPELQCEAVDNLVAIVKKRMDPSKKLELLKQTSILDIIERTKAYTHAAPEAFSAKIAELLDTTGANLIPAVQGGLGAAADMLHRTLTLSLAYLRHPSWRVSREVVSLFSSYFLMLKRRGQKASSDIERRIFTQTFDCIAQKLQFPKRYKHREPDELEVEFDKYREELDKLFKMMTRIHPEEMIGMVHGRFLQICQQLERTSWQQVEANMQMLFNVGENVGDLDGRLERGPFADMMKNLISRGISLYPHAHVAESYFVLVARYSHFLEANPQFRQGALAAFVDKRGMFSTDPAVRHQACYQMVRLFKAWSAETRKEVAAQFADQIVEAARKQVTTFAQDTTGNVLSHDEVLNLCEAVGILAGPLTLGPKSREYIMAVLRPLNERVSSLLQNKVAWQSNHMLAGKHISELIACMAALTKPFSASKDNEIKVISDILSSCLQTVIKAFMALPHHEKVREHTIFFLHRMTECLGSEIIPYFPQAVDALLSNSTSDTIIRVQQLIIDIINKIRAPLKDALASILMKMISKIFAILDEYRGMVSTGDHSGYSHRMLEQRDIHLHYYRIIGSILRFQLQDVLHAPTVKPHFKQILLSVVQGCDVPPGDRVVDKGCYDIIKASFGIFKQLVGLWGGSLAQMPELHAVLVQEVTEKTLSCPLNRRFNPNDAQANSVLREICSLQCELTKRLKTEGYVDRVGQLLLKAGAPQPWAEKYCNNLLKGSQKQLRNMLRELSVEMKKNR